MMHILKSDQLYVQLNEFSFINSNVPKKKQQPDQVTEHYQHRKFGVT